MEFGETIPLFFLSMCCFALTPAAGFSALAWIRFAKKDQALTRAVIITLLVVESLPFIYVTGALIYSLVVISRRPNSANLLTPQTVGAMIAQSISFAIWLAFLALTAAFLVAYGIVVPIMLVAQSAKGAPTEATKSS